MPNVDSAPTPIADHSQASSALLRALGVSANSAPNLLPLAPQKKARPQTSRPVPFLRQLSIYDLRVSPLASATLPQATAQSSAARQHRRSEHTFAEHQNCGLARGYRRDAANLRCGPLCYCRSGGEVRIRVGVRCGVHPAARIPFAAHPAKSPHATWGCSCLGALRCRREPANALF